MTRLVGAMYVKSQGVDPVHVPYKGGAPLMTDVVSGVTTIGVTSVLTAKQFITSGRLRAPAVTGARRTDALPDVPTMMESGARDFEAYTDYSLFAPAGTPRPVLDIAGAVLIGLGYGPITPASSHILIRTTPAHRLSVTFSIKQTGVPLGGVIVGLAIPPQEAAFGWSWAILSICFACLLMAGVAQLLRAELDRERGGQTDANLVASIAAPLRLVMTSRPLLALCACSFVFSGVQLALSVNLSSYLNLDLGWSLLAAGVVLSAMQFAGMVGRILWGAVSDARLGPRKTLAVQAVVMAGGCLATSLFHSDTSPVWIYLVLIVFGSSAVGWTGVYLAEVARLAPAGKVSIATGGALSFTFFAVVFWTPLFGFVASASGGYAVPYLLLCIPLLACLYLLYRTSPEPG